MASFKTQKASGIFLGLPKLMNLYGGNFRFFDAHRSMYNHSRKYFFPVFARPCPKKPRHGFVESRNIFDKVELALLWEEVKKADPNGELIIDEYFDSVEYNAVYVDTGLLSIGNSNDGATGGHNSISIPVAPTKLPNTIQSVSKINSKESVYVEAIYTDEFCPSLTQIRGGPAVEAAVQDYIPKNLVVKKVVIPNNDLLAWEEEARKFPAGTVVWGNGHTLSSHAAIHCVLNGVPFVITHKPKIGEHLSAKNKTNTKIDRAQFKKGCNVAMLLCKKFADEPGTLFYFVLSCLHNWPYLKNSKHSGWVLGAFTTVFAKLCAALIKSETKNYNYAYRKIGSDQVYYESLCETTGPLNNIASSYKKFTQYERWEPGYGGALWATCAWYSYSVWKNIQTIYNKQSKFITNTECALLVSDINKAINVSHNNGWWFNKISSSTVMNFAAKYPGLIALYVADLFKVAFDKKQGAAKIRTKKAINLPESFIKLNGNKMGWLRVYYSGHKKEISFAEIVDENGKVTNKKDRNDCKKNGILKYIDNRELRTGFNWVAIKNNKYKSGTIPEKTVKGCFNL